MADLDHQARREGVRWFNGAELPLGPKISGPYGAGQGLRRLLSACLFDFGHDRRHVDFRLRLIARCGDVVQSRPETVDPDGSLQSMLLRRPPVRATHAAYSDHIDGNFGILRQDRAGRSGKDQRRK